MNASKTVFFLSIAAAVAAALPAHAQAAADKTVRLARHHNHTVVRNAPARHVTVVQRPVIVQRPVVIQRPVTIARPVYVAPRAYSSTYGNSYGNYYGNYYRNYWTYYRSYWNYYWSYWTYWNRS